MKLIIIAETIFNLCLINISILKLKRWVKILYKNNNEICFVKMDI